jgi:hypothetical protein
MAELRRDRRYYATEVQSGQPAWRAGMRDGFRLMSFVLQPTTKRSHDSMKKWDDASFQEITAFSNKKRTEIIAIKINFGDMSPPWQHKGIWKTREEAINKKKTRLSPDHKAARETIRLFVRDQDATISNSYADGELASGEEDMESDTDDEPPRRSRETTYESSDSSETDSGTDSDSDDETAQARQLRVRAALVESRSPRDEDQGASTITAIDIDSEETADAMGQTISSDDSPQLEEANHETVQDPPRPTQATQATQAIQGTQSPSGIPVINPVRVARKKQRTGMLSPEFDLIDIDAGFMLEGADSATSFFGDSTTATKETDHPVDASETTGRNSFISPRHSSAANAKSRISIQAPVLSVESIIGPKRSYSLKPTCFAPSKSLTEEAIVLVCCEMARLISDERLQLLPTLLLEDNIKMEWPKPLAPVVCIPVRMTGKETGWSLIVIVSVDGVSTLFEFAPSGFMEAAGFTIGAMLSQAKINVRAAAVIPFFSSQDTGINLISSFAMVVKSMIDTPDSDITSKLSSTEVAVLERKQIQECVQAIMGDMILGDGLCWGVWNGHVIPCKVVPKPIASMVLTDLRYRNEEAPVVWIGSSKPISWLTRDKLQRLDSMSLKDALKKHPITSVEMQHITEAYLLATQ